MLLTPIRRVPINRVLGINPRLVATGDDDGVIKVQCALKSDQIVLTHLLQLWDPRQPDSLCTYAHHFDYISDFAYFDDERQLVSTS